MQPFSSGGHSEYNEKQEQTPSRFYAKHALQSSDGAQLVLDSLIDSGFTWEEAVLLANMREHLYENIEVRQRLEDDQRMHFARWLYRHGEVSEE